MASRLLLGLLPLGPGKASGGSRSFATARWLRPEMRTLERILELLVSERFPALPSQEIHSPVQELLPQSCEEAVPRAASTRTACGMREQVRETARAGFYLVWVGPEDGDTAGSQSPFGFSASPWVDLTWASDFL